MEPEERFIRECETRYGVTADSLAYCDTCPGRIACLRFMGEGNGPEKIPLEYVKGKVARLLCPRTVQIMQGEEPSANVEVCPDPNSRY